MSLPTLFAGMMLIYINIIQATGGPKAAAPGNLAAQTGPAMKAAAAVEAAAAAAVEAAVEATEDTVPIGEAAVEAEEDTVPVGEAAVEVAAGEDGAAVGAGFRARVINIDYERWKGNAENMSVSCSLSCEDVNKCLKFGLLSMYIMYMKKSVLKCFN